MTSYQFFQPVKKDPSGRVGGYIVIIVLLLTAVLLMLGLSLATRTTEEVALSGQEADTTRVFNAAETGVEEALYQIGVNPGVVPENQVTPTTIPVSQVGDASRDTTLTVTGQRADKFTLSIDQGEALSLKWREGTKISWTHNADCSDAAAIVVTLYQKGPPAMAYHAAFNPGGPIPIAQCQKGTNFSVSANATGGSTVTLTSDKFGLGAGAAVSTGSLLRIRPLYAKANFTIENSSAIDIQSTATDLNSGSGSEGTETRRIQVIRTDPAPPAIFDYAVFSGSGITKN